MLKYYIYLIIILHLFISCSLQQKKVINKIDMIGSWEGSDITLPSDSRMIWQFQTDSIFQEFGFYEGEWKTKGIWEQYEINDTSFIKLTYEDFKFESQIGKIIFYSKDSLIVELHTENDYSTFAFKRKKDENGNIVLNNPIFKLEPKNNDNFNKTENPTIENTPIVIAPKEIERQRQKQWINCSDCHGTGFDICGYCNGTKVNRCSKCYGDGVINKGTIFSPDTNGRGHTCPDCAGRGSKMCSNCYGKGNNGNCSNCGGSGQVLVYLN